jgi:hypothetical protein
MLCLEDRLLREPAPELPSVARTTCTLIHAPVSAETVHSSVVGVDARDCVRAELAGGTDVDERFFDVVPSAVDGFVLEGAAVAVTQQGILDFSLLVGDGHENA